MTESTLHITFSGNVARADYWVEISQVEPPDDTASIGDVAKLVDSLYGLDPCSEHDVDPDEMQTGSIDEVTGVFTPDATEEEQAAADSAAKDQFFLDKVQEWDKLDLCDIDAGGNYTTQLIIKLSHAEGDYRLVLTNGVVTRTVLSKYTPDAERPDEKIPARVFLADITVFGNAENQPGDCRAICFYQGRTDEAELTVPSNDGEENDRDRYCGIGGSSFTMDDDNDVITCYETITTQYFCECSGGLAYETTEDVVVACPDTMVKCSRQYSSWVDDHYECRQYLGSRTVLGDYIPCMTALYDPMGVERARYEDISVMADPDYYKARCCLPPTGPLPKCQVMYRKNSGGEEIDKTKLSKYKARYGDKLDLIPVSPEDGDCGTIKTVISDTPKQCCEFVTPIIWDRENSVEVLADNSSGFIVVTGGRLPFMVSVRGSGFFLNAGLTQRDGVVNSRQFFVYTGVACGTADIAIMDGCSECLGAVRSVNGYWGGVCIAYEYDTENFSIVYSKPQTVVTGIGGDCSISLENYVGPDTDTLNYGYATVRQWSHSQHYWQTIQVLGRYVEVGSYFNVLVPELAPWTPNARLNDYAPNGPSDVPVCTHSNPPCRWVC